MHKEQDLSTLDGLDITSSWYLKSRGVAMHACKINANPFDIFIVGPNITTS